MTPEPPATPRTVTALDLFSIGIGPSSSHTVGPMRAATAFVAEVRAAGALGSVTGIRITLYGSLAATGVGHGTLGAIIVGLEGAEPATVDPLRVSGAWDAALDAGIALHGGSTLPLTTEHLTLKPFTRMPAHPNALRLEALGESDVPLADVVYYSIGGGFIERAVSEDGAGATVAGQGNPEGQATPAVDPPPIPYPFASADELLRVCAESGLDIAGVALANAAAESSVDEVFERLDAVWAAMRACVEAGLEVDGVLPGWLAVPRRAAGIARTLRARETNGDPDTAMEWLQGFAIAVNEQNAAGARVVTAPTNGAAGIIPAVGYYAAKYRGMTEPAQWRTYLLTAGAIGALCKLNASISGAEAGCQGEVGSACSMAAAGFTAVLGGSPVQVENAAEVAMEHHLGLTCDPIGGFVQVPCIERNAIAAGTAVAATRLALMGDGTHLVSLDTVIETMRQTGRDMSQNYKETSRAGLAVNIVEC